MRKLLLATCLIASVAGAGTKIPLHDPPSPPGEYPLDFAPYTFVTGFSPDGNTIEGVCGYNFYWSTRNHAWYSCSWSLTGVPTLGAEICCDEYTDRPPRPVYGPFTNYAGDTIATPYSGGPPYLLLP